MRLREQVFEIDTLAVKNDVEINENVTVPAWSSPASCRALLDPG